MIAARYFSGSAPSLAIEDFQEMVVGAPGGLAILGGRFSLLAAPFRVHGLCLEGRLVGDAVQPAAHLGAWEDRGRLAEKHEEGGLVGVLSVGLVPQDAPADTEDHRPMTAYKQGKRLLVAVGEETVEQRGITHGDTGFWMSSLAKMADDALERTGRHGIPPGS